ncbi:MAG: hypothetical protein JO142_07135 [Burkholderiales bacterium]|nr:hypothetical protein [Burkholderiales bacterium]
MKNTMIILLMAVGIASGRCAAQGSTASSEQMSDKERIDSLIKQNAALTEENLRLRSLAERPKTREELFATCMRATKGETSPMAAESIGEHCDQLLKK